MEIHKIFLDNPINMVYSESLHSIFPDLLIHSSRDRSLPMFPSIDSFGSGRLEGLSMPSSVKTVFQYGEYGRKTRRRKQLC